MRPRPFLAVWLLLLAGPLLALDIRVYVYDSELGLPLEGAEIRLPDGGTFFCDGEGVAVLSAPENGQLLVQVRYPGYETLRRVLRAEVGQYEFGMSLTGILEGRELVVEAARPESGQTVTARSVAVAGREISQTAEIGIVEDLMATIRLLPGVGYTGMFNAQPSIRGGDPGDLRASFDGFYVFNPFHWGGGFSIFDPRMVESAQLSHGVFSVRHGHTISGLLDVRSKSPSPTETEFEVGASSSAASAALSLPLYGRGGILFMARVTYYDPVISLAKALSEAYPPLSAVNSIRVAPYIRSGTVTGNYRFTDRLEFGGTAFWGMDGTGANFEDTSYRYDKDGEILGIDSHLKADFDYANYQGFASGRLSYNPRNDMLLGFSAGLGYTDVRIDGEILSESFEEVGTLGGRLHSTRSLIRQSDLMFNVQGRTDFDWELGSGLLFAAGVQEMFSRASQSGRQEMRWQRWLDELPPDIREEIREQINQAYGNFDLSNLPIMVSFPVQHNPDAHNLVFATSAYALLEWQNPEGRLGAELGLRADHFHVKGRTFSLGTVPVLNPRLNLSYNLLRNLPGLESMDLALGTGLFSSMNNAIFSAEEQYRIDEIRPNRSWTSVAGMNLAFPEGLGLNLEFYYRHVFDRMYVPVEVSPNRDPEIRPNFDGIGRIWGADLMLRRVQSRMLDGWLSYSFNWAKYLDPDGDGSSAVLSGAGGSQWYFPSYHRFHNLNLVLNFRPTPRFNIYARLGLASGVQLSRRIGDKPQVFPVFVYTPGETGYFVIRYFWPSVPDENNRTSASMPMDVKFSMFGGGRAPRSLTRWELYFAVENVLGLLSSQLGLSQGNQRFDQYTGEVSQSSFSANYEIPIPVPSLGFKITF